MVPDNLLISSKLELTSLEHFIIDQGIYNLEIEELRYRVVEELRLRNALGAKFAVDDLHRAVLQSLVR